MRTKDRQELVFFIAKKFFKKSVRAIFIPKTFKAPRKAKVLIYDIEGSAKLRRFLFYSTSTEAIPTRGEKLSIPCLLRALFLVRLRRLGKTRLNTLLFDAYVDSWISFCKPSIVATFIDNDPRFYTIKSRWAHEGVKTIALQNGARDSVFEKDLSDFVEANCLSQLSCDILAVFGSVNLPIYQRNISAKFINYGSLLNNHSLQEHKQSSRSKRILFVSQYRKSLSGTDFYSAERILLPILQKWCQEKGLELNILGCCSCKEGIEDEKVFFSKILGGFKRVNYLTKSSSYENHYRSLDDSLIVVAVDSTLGLEALGRQCKTIFYIDSRTKEPYPRLCIERETLMMNGIAFFVDIHSESSIYSQLDYLINEPTRNWLSRLKVLENEIMSIDPESHNLHDELSTILGKSTDTKNKQ